MAEHLADLGQRRARRRDLAGGGVPQPVRLDLRHPGPPGWRRNFEREHHADLPERDLLGQFGKPARAASPDPLTPSPSFR